MFGRKKSVLSASICGPLEQIRQAVEVLTGRRTCFVHMDFENGRGRVRVGEDEKDMSFTLTRDDLVQFTLGEFGKNWFDAHFDENGEVFVASLNNPQAHARKTAGGLCLMRWAGKSSTERREEPLFFDEAKRYAKALNISLEELLNTHLKA